MSTVIPLPFPTAAVRPVRVLVVDDNPVVRAGLAALLATRDGIEVVAQAADGRQACEAASAHRPDVVLLDVRMPGVDGMSALPYLVPIAPVLMLTYSQESEIVQEAIRRGAGGYLVHGEFTVDQLVGAVRDITEGRACLTPTAATALLAQARERTPARSLQSQYAPLQLQSNVGESGGTGVDRARYGLSQREEEVMELIAGGMTNHQIAATCFISEKTVKNHINRIFAKLHADSRSQAIAVWLGTVRGPVRHG
ncbi:response regulator transcription factor [Streptomyces sp. NPDC020096]